MHKGPGSTGPFVLHGRNDHSTTLANARASAALELGHMHETGSAKSGPIYWDFWGGGVSDTSTYPKLNRSPANSREQQQTFAECVSV